MTNVNMNMNNPAEVPEKLRLANLKPHNEVWGSRHDMARATLSAAKAVRGARESLAGPAADGSKNKLPEDGKGSLVLSAVALAVAAATIRLGGRAALISVRNKLGCRVRYGCFTASLGRCPILVLMSAYLRWLRSHDCRATQQPHFCTFASRDRIRMKRRLTSANLSQPVGCRHTSSALFFVETLNSKKMSLRTTSPQPFFVSTTHRVAVALRVSFSCNR